MCIRDREITVPAFKVITVFDISQTEGKEFPDLSVKPLLADGEQYEDFFAALEKASPVPITFEQITNGANGYFSLTDKRIAIKEGEMCIRDRPYLKTVKGLGRSYSWKEQFGKE